jgi:hypothetical protein
MREISTQISSKAACGAFCKLSVVVAILFGIISSAEKVSAQDCPTHDKNGKECIQATPGSEESSGWTIPTIYVTNGCGCRCSISALDSRGQGRGVVVGPYSSDKITCINTHKYPETDCTGFQNEITYSCHPPDGIPSQPRSETPQRGAPANPREASQDAQRKADEARLKAREGLKKEEEERAKEEAEKKKLKQEAAAPSAVCQQQVQACEERNKALSNLTPGTQSQCATYCRNMQIESCNPSSPTLRQGAQACTEGAERDQKEAADRAQRLKDAREAEARKWHCFGETGSVREGYNRCLQECSNFYGSGSCKSQCYASNTGSLANGRSCFKEP